MFQFPSKFDVFILAKGGLFGKVRSAHPKAKSQLEKYRTHSQPKKLGFSGI
jgi:hypothetical protein